MRTYLFDIRMELPQSSQHQRLQVVPGTEGRFSARNIDDDIVSNVQLAYSALSH